MTASVFTVKMAGRLAVGLLNVFFIGLCLFYVTSGSSLNTAVQRSPPGLESPPKVWWAKEITPDFHIGGRLTYRQIKYVYEAGFNSIVSLFIYEDNDPGSHGGEYLPTTAEAEELATSLGLGYEALIDKHGEWWTVETVQLLSDSIQNLPLPIYLHCNRGYTIAFTTLMYMANRTRYDPGFEPKINSDTFYRIVAAMGLDFTKDHIKQAVSEITGEDFVTDPPRPDQVPSNWRDWWLAHPVAKNWYSAGQITKADIKVLEKTGFKAVVNLRLGTTQFGIPSQEQVTLLNVEDNTSTYADDVNPPRQSSERLNTSRLYLEMDPDYISEDSEVNYERRNPGEFGDDIGYNEELERAFFQNHQIDYYHVPLNVQGSFEAKKFEEILNILNQAGQKGPVLVHCRDGQRAAYVAVLAAARQEGYSVLWALQRLRELGFEADEEVRRDVYELYQASLASNGDGQAKDEL